MATSMLVHVCFVVLCFASTVLSEPAVSVVGNSMIINVGGATVSLESTDCTATGSSMTATQERVDSHVSSLQASLSSSVTAKNDAVMAVAGGVAAAQGAAVANAAAVVAPSVAFVSGLRAVLGSNLENVVTKSSIDTALSSIAVTATASLQATTAAATDSAAVMLQSQTSRVVRTATQFAQTSAYVDVVMNVTGAALENLVTATAADATGATISTIISSLPSTTATNTATLVAAVAPQVSAVSAQAASAMTYLNSVRASAGNNLENLATIASVNASINSLNGDISDILTTQLSTTSNIVSAITANQTGLVNANVAQNAAPLNYISALQNFSGSSVQNLVTTFTVAGQATTVRTNITTAMSTQQSTIYANLAAAVTTSITSVANSIDSQSSRLIVIDNKVGVISTMVEDIRQETSLNAATLASALGVLASLEASLLDLSNNHNQSFTNATSAISTIRSTIVIEVSRASTAEAAINTANAQLSTAISTNTVRMSQMVACNAGGRVWSSSTSTCIDTIRRCNAAMNGRSRYNSANNFIEYCDGTTWQTMWNLLGATQRQFSTSCAAIYAANSQAMSGVYWIGASFAAAKRTYCQFSDDGAWVLVAMMADIEDEQWQFQSATWTSSNTINPLVVDPDTDVHMKNDYYNTMAFRKFKFIMTSLNSFPFKVTTSASSLMAFMAAGTQITTTFGRARWIQATGYPSSYWDNSPNCNAEGVNLNGGSNPNFYRCRFGIAFNNEGDCNTCDSGLGFGCYQNGQVASGPHRIGCGGVCFSNDGRYSRRGWILIQQ